MKRLIKWFNDSDIIWACYFHVIFTLQSLRVLQFTTRNLVIVLFDFCVFEFRIFEYVWAVLDFLLFVVKLSFFED